MKKKKIITALSVLLIVSIIATGCGKDIEVKNGSKVAVKIKGNKYTATEYYERIKEDNISILVDMIDKDLLSKKYKDDKKEKEEIDKQIEQIKSYYGGNEETYKSIIKQYFGVEDEDELREKLSLEYKRKKAVEKYIEKNLSDNEIKKYYEDEVFGKVKASHILITVKVDENATEEEKEKADAKAKEKAEKIIKELNEGKKFSKLAKKYSEDESNATNGGDLGYFELNDMVTEFSDAVKDLKKNEYTKEPVKTEYGDHIILKTGEKDKPSLKEAKKEIKEKLREQKLNDDPSTYYETLRKIREESKIKWNDDTLKKAYNKYMDDLIENSKQKQEEETQETEETEE